MEKKLESLIQILNRILGSHRQLLETVRREREVLISMEMPRIQAMTHFKEGLVVEVQQMEAERIQVLADLSVDLRKPANELTLQQVILRVEPEHPQLASRLRTALNSLSLLIQRIQEQNQSNEALIQQTLNHLRQMNQNVRGEATAKSSLYTPKAQRSSGGVPPQFISQEA